MLLRQTITPSQPITDHLLNSFHSYWIRGGATQASAARSHHFPVVVGLWGLQIEEKAVVFLKLLPFRCHKQVKDCFDMNKALDNHEQESVAIGYGSSCLVQLLSWNPCWLSHNRILLPALSGDPEKTPLQTLNPLNHHWIS